MCCAEKEKEIFFFYFFRFFSFATSHFNVDIFPSTSCEECHQTGCAYFIHIIKKCLYAVYILIHFVVCTIKTDVTNKWDSSLLITRYNNLLKQKKTTKKRHVEQTPSCNMAKWSKWQKNYMRNIEICNIEVNNLNEVAAKRSVVANDYHHHHYNRNHNLRSKITSASHIITFFSIEMKCANIYIRFTLEYIWFKHKM